MFKINRKTHKPEIMDQWDINGITLITHSGEYLVNVSVTITKMYKSWYDTPTLIERIFNKEKMYWYKVKFVITNDDLADVLNEINADNGLEFNVLNDSISRPVITQDVIERLAIFNPNCIKMNRRRKENKSWRHKTVIDHVKHDNKIKFGCFTCIYKFFGGDTSGWTSIISLRIGSDDEYGIRFAIGILGVHFYIFSWKLYKILYKLGSVGKPIWDRDNQSWAAYYYDYKKWAPNHKFKNALVTSFDYEIGLSRANGFFFNGEVDGCSKGIRSFNPWRNKLWRII